MRARVDASRDDARALVVIAVLTVLSLLTQVYTRQTEVIRAGLRIDVGETWLLESTSHLIVLALAALTPLALNLAPPRFLPAHRTALISIGAFAAFAVAHVVLMYASRVALFPLLIGHAYEVQLLAPRHFLYEASKDALIFPAILLAFVAARALGAARRDAEAARREATATKKIRLKVGSGEVSLLASGVLWAKAAGNYAEVHTSGKTHFCRITLAELTDLLVAAGAPHARVHRSYVVNLDAIVASAPTGEGDLTLTLASGATVPCSRRYRSALAQK